MSDPVPATTRANAAPQSMPVFSCELALKTSFAQQVYKRAWDRLKADLFVTTVRTCASGMDAAAEAIERFITDEFSKIRKDLDAELERTDVLIDNVKLSDTPEYKLALHTRAEFSTPRAKEYLDLLVKMDQLLVRMDTLWLGGIIETRARQERSVMWKRRLIKVANRLREVGNQTRASIARHLEQRGSASGASTPAVEPAAESEPHSEGSDAEPTSVLSVDELDDPQEPDAKPHHENSPATAAESAASEADPVTAAPGALPSDVTETLPVGAPAARRRRAAATG